MATNQRTAKPARSTWEGFLPARALVMGKNRSTVSVQPATPSFELVFVSDIQDESEEASKLLERMIEAMGLAPGQAKILTIKKDDPSFKQYLETLQPKIIVALGTSAAQAVLDTEDEIAQMRGTFRALSGVQVMPTLHPSFLLRNPGSKREAWSDLQQVAKALGITIPGKN